MGGNSYPQKFVPRGYDRTNASTDHTSTVRTYSHGTIVPPGVRTYLNGTFRTLCSPHFVLLKKQFWVRTVLFWYDRTFLVRPYLPGTAYPHGTIRTQKGTLNVLFWYERTFMVRTYLRGTPYPHSTVRTHWVRFVPQFPQKFL